LANKSTTNKAAVKVEPAEKLLVIVDMQDGFKAGTDYELIQRINKEQVRRRAQGWEVLYLCYDASGDLTVKQLSGAAKIYKEKDDGSHAIMAFIAGWGCWPTTIEFWGINLLCCVFATMTGVADKLRGIGKDSEIVIRVNMDYCFDYSDYKDIEIVGEQRRRLK
jgi:hypothetical protein